MVFSSKKYFLRKMKSNDFAGENFAILRQIENNSQL